MPPIDMDAEGAEWFPVEALPALTGDHPEILAYALRRLRYKLEYSAVGFQLLPENFSLSELQQTYEMILGETLDKRNFRRRMLQAGIIEPERRCCAAARAARRASTATARMPWRKSNPGACSRNFASPFHSHVIPPHHG